MLCRLAFGDNRDNQRRQPKGDTLATDTQGEQQEAEEEAEEHPQPSARLGGAGAEAEQGGAMGEGAELEAESAVHENTVSFKHFPYFTVKAPKCASVCVPQCVCVCVGERP